MSKKLTGFTLGLLLTTAAYVAFAAYQNQHTGADEDFHKSVLKEQSAGLQEGIELKLMTYNVANARGFTTNQRDRIAAVADLLIELDADIVGLQEVFIKKDRDFLIEKLSSTELKYTSEYPAGYLGNGLVIVSKYPIRESYFHRFKANNPWWKVWEGDWWAGKGIGMARVQINENAYIDFYNVHAQAYRGNQESHDVRYLQYQEATEFLNQSALKNTPAFLVGDFNTERGMPDYEYVVEHANLERLMTIDSEIDHITAISNPAYSYEVLETEEIFRQIPAKHAGMFYSRAPTPKEFWELHFAEAESGSITEISDHPGYISHIKIIPKTETPDQNQPEQKADLEEKS